MIEIYSIEDAVELIRLDEALSDFKENFEKLEELYCFEKRSIIHHSPADQFFVDFLKENKELGFVKFLNEEEFERIEKENNVKLFFELYRKNLVKVDFDGMKLYEKLK